MNGGNRSHTGLRFLGLAVSDQGDDAYAVDERRCRCPRLGAVTTCRGPGARRKWREGRRQARFTSLSDKVEVAYRRGDMREKRRRMMADWADYCESPPAERSDNVVPDASLLAAVEL